MIFKDRSLLAEAYISATQKSVNVPPNIPQPENDTPPVTLSLTNEPSVEKIPSYSDEPERDCGCTNAQEEAEEDYMTKSNLFSLFVNAKKLHHLCMNGVEMESWMQQKIAVCADNLESVIRSARYEAAVSGVDCD